MNIKKFLNKQPSCLKIVLSILMLILSVAMINYRQNYTIQVLGYFLYFYSLISFIRNVAKKDKD